MHDEVLFKALCDDNMYASRFLTGPMQRGAEVLFMAHSAGLATLQGWICVWAVCEKYADAEIRVFGRNRKKKEKKKEAKQITVSPPLTPPSSNASFASDEDRGVFQRFASPAFPLADKPASQISTPSSSLDTYRRCAAFVIFWGFPAELQAFRSCD